MSAETLVPGTLLGFRQFRVDEQGRLLPMYVGNTPWESTTVARCAAHAAHRPPVEGCGCGLHAWHHASDALARTAQGAVVGAVRAHGRIVLAEHGFRAERADIVAVCLPARWTARRRAEVRERLTATYPGLEVHDSARVFRRRFPAEELSALGVCSRPTAKVRHDCLLHLPWVLGVVALYSAMVWPPAADAVLAGGGWVVLIAAFVGWQAWLVRHALTEV